MRARIYTIISLLGLVAVASAQTAAETAVAEVTGGSMMQYLLTAVGAALVALLTPCVFPMVPVTVSYFAKQSQTNPELKVKGPLAYSLGIISTFTVVGIGASLLFGVSGITSFAQHPVTNVALGILFVVLALNLFGVFEIKMPSWLVNKTNEGRKRGGLIAPFAMGLTFALTSFTCTVAFVATLLALAADKGDILTPAIGLFVFGFVFALPFFLLALFPGGLSKVPKSGSWMVTLKGFLGFIELIAALKFFQNAEYALQLGWVSRDLFLASWVVLFFLAGIYLMGWMVIPNHEAKIGWLRRGFGVATFAVAIFFMSGIAGRSLGFYEGFMPGKYYATSVIPETKWIENDLPAAIAQAKKENKQIFIDFTGYTCVNCRRMENDIFPKPEVREAFGKYVLLKLYTDDIINNPDRSMEYQELQTKLVGAISLPYYVIVDTDLKPLYKQKDWEPDASKFVAFLKQDAKYKVASK